MDGDEAGNPASPGVLVANHVARALGGRHEDVDIGAGYDLSEVDIEPVAEGEECPFFHEGLDLLPIHVALEFVGDQDHEDVRHLGGFCGSQNGEARLFGLGPGTASLPEADDHIDSAVLEIIGVGVALAAVADDSHFFAAEHIHIGVFVVINLHF